MRFRGLDLNLLAVFQGLMQTRSVTGAARLMHLSQPAMSAALGRLREYFGDPLLVVHGKRMYPTAFAESLLPQVRECLGLVECIIMTTANFDPATSHRTFNVIASDYVISALIAPLIARLAQEAPSIRIHLSLPDENSVLELVDGRADLLITPQEFADGQHPVELLFEEQHVLVGWAGNPLFESPITEAEFRAAGHIAVTIGKYRTPSFADRELALMGQHRRIEVETASFASVPWLLVDTMRLAVMHKRLADRAATTFPIRVAPLPFAFPNMREIVQYHRTRAGDEGVSWLRATMREMAAIDLSG